MSPPLRTIEHPLRRRAFAPQIAALVARGPGARGWQAAFLAAATERLGELRRLVEARAGAQHELTADPRRAAEVGARLGLVELSGAEARRAVTRGWVDAALVDERLTVLIARVDLDASLALELATLNEDAGSDLEGALSRALAMHDAPLSARAAARAIGASRWSEGAAQRLRTLLVRGAPVPRNLAAAMLEALWRLGAEQARPRLEEVLAERSGGDAFLLRQQVIAAMIRQGPADAKLLARALDDPSEHVRLSIPRAASSLGPPDRLHFITALLADTSEKVRAACAEALGLLRDATADERALLWRLRSDPSAAVARVAEDELARWVTSGLDPSGSLVVQAPARDWAGLVSRARLSDLTDARFRELNAKWGGVLSALKEGEACFIASAAAPELLGQLLAFHAREDFGLYARAVTGGYRVTRGASLGRRWWRLLNEVLRPTPYKRQDQLHSIGRRFDGELRAPSPLLAESTPTIPGEPVEVSALVGWGSFVPTVDDLLSVALFRPRPVVIFTAAGSTRITPPPTFAGRLRARWFLGTRYPALAELRRASLAPTDAKGASRYLEQLRTLGFEVVQHPHVTQEATEQREAPVPAAVAGAFPLLLATQLPDWLSELRAYALTPADNTLPELGLAVSALGLWLLMSNLVQRERIRRDRQRLPLVMGGWGTRGKSGTERLKAAMLGAQGVALVAKTTGCEAMFIHHAPGLEPCEIFIHRSYDKATIWEQRDLLSLAAALRCDAFLWECMALSPPLVRVLQRHWMQDDLSTLTNAYPDHEDIQGPAGHDVARVISQFIRPGGTVFTSEDQMLPILRAEANAVGAQLTHVGWRDELLIGGDLLARFPYQEHPRNIALVRGVATELGLDPELATADMADQIVPDLGVLKTYPKAEHRGRSLTFVNGMSANERTGFLSNWKRTGFDAPRTESARWLVTVVNNRQDRVARSKVFAEIIVGDAAADRHVLIGTNLSGLRNYVRESLERWLTGNALMRDDDGAGEVEALARQRLAAMAAQLRVGACSTDALGRELAALSGEPLEPTVLERWVAQARARAEKLAVEGDLGGLRLEITLEQMAKILPETALTSEARQFAVRSLSRRALLHALAHRCGLETSPEARAVTVAIQRQIHRELLEEMIVSVNESSATGDQIIDQIARSCPPGADAQVMGIQNIKGTGLDFVYRFVRLDEVDGLTRGLASATPAQAESVAARLAKRVDFGMLDAALAGGALAEAATRVGGPVAATLQDTAARLASLADQKRVAAAQPPGGSRAGWLRVLGRMLDPLDAIWRRRRADAVLGALAAGLISHPRAAAEMRSLVAREKGGWLLAK